MDYSEKKAKRGDAQAGGVAASSKSSQSSDSLYKAYKSNSEAFVKGKECLDDYIERNSTFEMQKDRLGPLKGLLRSEETNGAASRSMWLRTFPFGRVTATQLQSNRLGSFLK